MTDKRRARLNGIYAELKKGFCTKEYLMNMFDVSKERTIREDIDYIRDFFPVIAVSSKQGYKIPSSKEDLELAKQTVAEAYSRAREAVNGVAKTEEWIAEVENG